VFTLEATIGIFMLSLNVKLKVDEDGKPQRTFLVNAALVTSVGFALLITGLTNAMYMIEALNVQVNPQAVDLFSVVAMGVLIPPLGIAHSLPINWEIMSTRYLNQALEEEDTQTRTAWRERAKLAYNELQKASAPEVTQEMTRQKRREEIWKALDEGLTFDDPAIAETAAHYGVVPATIRRDIADYTPKAGF